MKISLFSVLFTILIVLLLITTFASCTDVVPYSREGIFTNMYPYEGFTTEYSSYPENKSKDSYTSYDIVKSNDNQYMGSNGLLSSPDSTKMNPNDIYSTASGEPSCKSFGLSNSRGYLCLNDEQVRLLTTRGGNSSGKDMQIGGVASK